MSKPSGKVDLYIQILLVILLLISGCATNRWDRQRKQLKHAYKQGEINDDNYELLMRKVDKDERAFLQQSQESKILRQQAREKEREGYYIPPAQAGAASKKGKICSARCDYYGNCENICE